MSCSTLRMLNLDNFCDTWSALSLQEVLKVDRIIIFDKNINFCAKIFFFREGMTYHIGPPNDYQCIQIIEVPCAQCTPCKASVLVTFLVTLWDWTYDLHRATTVPLNLCDCFDDNNYPILLVVWVPFVEQKEEQGMKLNVLYKSHQIIATSKKDGENRTLRKHLPLSSNFRQETQWNPIKPNIMWPYHLP